MRIAGERTCSWRAVDSEGEALNALVRRRRDKHAAREPMREPLRKQGFAPAEIATDKPSSYTAAYAEPGLSARHEQDPRKNNRAGVSHQPFRRWEREVRLWTGVEP